MVYDCWVVDFDEVCCVGGDLGCELSVDVLFLIGECGSECFGVEFGMMQIFVELVFVDCVVFMDVVGLVCVFFEVGIVQCIFFWIFVLEVCDCEIQGERCEVICGVVVVQFGMVIFVDCERYFCILCELGWCIVVELMVDQLGLFFGFVFNGDGVFDCEFVFV